MGSSGPLLVSPEHSVILLQPSRAELRIDRSIGDLIEEHSSYHQKEFSQHYNPRAAVALAARQLSVEPA